MGGTKQGHLFEGWHGALFGTLIAGPSRIAPAVASSFLE